MDKTRTISLIGERAAEKLAASSVAVFGLGGVGSYCAEALCRVGVGKLLLCDGDVVSPSNLNRQLYALSSTVGEKKALVAKKRCEDINDGAEIIAAPVFFDQATQNDFDFCGYDFVVDCIDRVTSKLLIIEKARAAGTPVVSCMGTGNRLDCSKFKIADVEKTSGCSLARVMRRELKKRGVSGVPVLFSEEKARLPLAADKRTPASVAFVPAVAGLTLANYVVNRLIDGLLEE